MRAHGWFHGQNSLGQPLADVQCGACFDGLQLTGVNRNQGAESTLAYLWTQLHRSRESQSPRILAKATAGDGYGTEAERVGIDPS